MVAQNTFPLHLAQFIGHGAAVNAQIVGKLLPVEGDRKAVAAAAFGLLRKIGEQPAPNGFGRGVQTAAGKSEVFLGRDLQEVLNQFVVVGAGALTGGDQLPCVQEQNAALLAGDYGHHQRLSRDAGIGLRKKLARIHMTENGLVSPQIVDLNVDAAGKHQPHILHTFPDVQDRVPFSVLVLIRPQAGKHLPGLLRTRAPEQCGVRQKYKIHFFLHLCCYNNILVGTIIVCSNQKVKDPLRGSGEGGPIRPRRP